MLTQTLKYKYLFKGIDLVQSIAEGIGAFKTKEKDIDVNIPFYKPYMTGNEQKHISSVLSSRKLSGDGFYTKSCQEYFEKRYNIKKCFLTSSCSDALEMSAVLIDIKEGDEVIMPSYTFVSSANAFILQGAKVVFADSRKDHPGMDENLLEDLITPKTKAIVIVHYAGVATNMDKVMALAEKHGLYVIEDAAQAIDATYKGKPLGTIGHLGTMSFHETKNIISGEGGMLMVNDERFIERAEIIREKGTDRSKFMRGEVDKYGWVDVGSSYLPNEMTAAFLYAQLEELETIQKKRLDIWHRYYDELKELAILGYVKLPVVPDYAKHNAHKFYLVLPDEYTQNRLRTYLKDCGITSVFHYSPLHSSKYHTAKHGNTSLPNCEHYGKSLLRLPLFPDLSEAEQMIIVSKIWDFFIR